MKETTKESGEWEIWDKTIEEIKKFEFMQDFITSDGTTFSPTGIIGSIEPVLMDGVREMLAHAEKQAMSDGYSVGQEDGYCKGLLATNEEAYQRGADEMVEKAIAMVPENPSPHAYSRTWIAGFATCREAILTSLRSLQSKE